MQVLSGKSVSNGIGIGKIIKVESIKEPSKGMVLNPFKEMENFDDYLKQLRNELLDLKKQYKESDVFNRLHDAACDKHWIDEIKKYVGQMSMNLAYSIKSVSEKMGSDYVDNAYRLIRIINNIEPLIIEDAEDVVVVARRLNMSDVIRFNEDIVKGIVTEEALPKEDSITIPHIYDINIKAVVGSVAIVDSDKSLLLIDQSEDIIERYKQQIQINEIQTGGLTRFIGTETKTKDLKKIELSGKLDKLSDYDLIMNNDSDSIVILNEDLFTSENALLSVESQINIYKKAFNTLKNKPLNVKLSYSSDITISNRLKALVMASKYGRVRIMLSNVYDVDTLKKVKSELQYIEKKLLEENIEFKAYEVGLIISTPEVAIMSSYFMELIDFIIIDADLLSASLLGVHRNMDATMYNIAFLKMLKGIINNAESYTKWVGLYSHQVDMQDIMSVLIGLGVTKIFIQANQTLRHRKYILKHDYKYFVELAKESIHLPNAVELHNFLEKNVKVL